MFKLFLHRFLLPVYEVRKPCRYEFCQAEGVPDAVRAEKTAQEIGCGDNKRRVPKQRDIEGRRPFPQTFESAGAGDGNSRNDEAEADNVKGVDADSDCLCVRQGSARTELFRRT